MKSTRKSTLGVAGLSLISAILGFMREAYIASSYGANAVTDAYYVASVIPDLVAGWLSYSITNALIPVLKESFLKSEKDTRDLADAVFSGALIIFVLLSTTVFFIRGHLIQFLAPGLSVKGHILALRFLTIMIPAILFSGLSGVLWGIHNAYENFSYPALVGIVFNVVFLTVVMFGQKIFSTYTLAAGFTLGTFGRLLIQLVPILRSNQLMIFGKLFHRDVVKVISSSPAILMSVGVTSSSLIVDRMLASGLPTGRISDLNYAVKLGTLPEYLIGAALATTLYTRFVQHNLNNDLAALRKSVTDALGIVIFVSLIIGSSLVALNREFVSILFQHGQFSQQDVLDTGAPVKLYGLFTIVYVMAPIFTHFFYARQNNSFVFRTSVLTVTLNIVGSILLVHSLGIVGLVLANGLSQLVYTVVLLTSISKELRTNPLLIVTEALRQGFVPGVVAASTISVLAWMIAQGAPQSWVHSLNICIVVCLPGLILLTVYTKVVSENRISIYTRHVIKDISCGFKSIVHRVK